MLAGVLLHVIEAPRPIDLARDDVAGLQRARHEVRDRAVLTIDDVADRGAAERTGVERLAARRGIKRRLIEHDVPGARRAFDAYDRGIKGLAIGLGVIQPVRHRSSWL